MMIAISIASVGILAVLAAWHVALRIVANRVQMRAWELRQMAFEKSVDASVAEVLDGISAEVTTFATRLELAEKQAAELSDIAREMRNARQLSRRA